jgi:hypothetical protein
VVFRNDLIFYGEEFLVPRPVPMLEAHLSSAVRNCLFSIFSIFRSITSAKYFDHNMSIFRGDQILKATLKNIYNLIYPSHKIV